MKVSRKIGVGYCCLVALVIACGAVGWNILGRMTTIVEFISGPAWDTADGCMEFTIQLQAQVIAVRDIVDGHDSAELHQHLTEAREGTQEALAQTLKHEMVPADQAKDLVAAVGHYEKAQADLLRAQDLFVSAKQAALASAAALHQPNAPAQIDHTAQRSRVPVKLASQRSVMKPSTTKPTTTPATNSTQTLGNIAPVEYLLAIPADRAHATLKDTTAQERTAAAALLAGKPEHATYVAALDRYIQTTTAAIDARAAQQSAITAHNAAAEDVLGRMPGIEEKTDGLLDTMVPVIASTTAYSRTAIIVTIAISLAVAIAASLLVTRSIMRPLHAVIAGLKDMADGEGDLTRRLDEDRSDELAELAKWFNVFVGKLQGIIQRLAQNSVQLARSSTEVSATSSDLAGVADETKQRSATVAAAAEEMSINMKNMASSTETMSQSVRMVASSVEELHITINEVAKNADRAHSVAGHAAQLAETSNTMVAQLGSAADGIGKVIEVIQEIAEQTSLLALNATIEAARAGDAGKGFAVVATEVKELAKQTASATEDIRQRIEGIQTSSRQAIEAIGSIGSVILDVNEVSRTIASAVEEQSIATKEIAKNVAQTASAAEVVSRSVNESAAASQEITQSITGVDAAAQRALGGASKTRTAGVELEELSQQINGLVAQFQV